MNGFVSHLKSERGIEAAGLRQGGRRLFHLALERISGRQTPVRLVSAPAGVDCLFIFVYGGVEMPEAKFCVTQTRPAKYQSSDRADLTVSLAAHRISLARNGRGNFGQASRPVERRVIRIDGKSGVGCAEPLIRALRNGQV